MQVILPTPPPLPPPVEPGGFVFARGQPCLHCGYDLRSMELSAVCPECGGACLDALGSLSAAKPEDVAMLVSGLRRMAFAAIGFPLLMAALTAIDIWSEVDRPRLANVGAIGVGVVGPLLALSGLLRVSTRVSPDPTAKVLRKKAVVEEDAGTMASAAKAHVMFAILLTILMMILVNRTSHSGNEEVWAWVAGGLATGMGLGWAIRNALMSVRCAEFAARSNAKGLRRMFIGMAWASVAMAIGVVLYAIAAMGMYVFRDQIFTYGPGRADSLMAKVLVALGVVHAFASMCWMGWIFLWPLMIGAMARHLRKVGGEAAGRGAVLGPRLGVGEPVESLHGHAAIESSGRIGDSP